MNNYRVLRAMRRFVNAVNAHKLRALVATVFVTGIIPAIGTAIFTPDRLHDWWHSSTEAVDNWQFHFRQWIAGIPSHKEENPRAKAYLSSLKIYLETRKSNSYSEDKEFLATIAGEPVDWDGFVASVSGARIWITTVPTWDTFQVYNYTAVACLAPSEEWKKAITLLGSTPIGTKIKVSGILAVIESGPGFLNDCKVERIISRPPE